MIKIFSRYASDESASVNIEYGMIALIIAVGLIGVIGNIGTTISANYNAVAGTLTSNDTTGSISP